MHNIQTENLKWELERESAFSNFTVNEEFHEKHEYKLLNYPKRNENVYLAYSLKLYSLYYATSQQFDEPTLHNVTHDKG